MIIFFWLHVLLKCSNTPLGFWDLKLISVFANAFISAYYFHIIWVPIHLILSLFPSFCRNAFGPSFGTVCFSGMIMGAVRVIRAIVDSAKREGIAPGIVNFITQCCAKVLLSACDFVNKFTIIFTAITGEGYCSSAKMTYELLKRNLLSAVFVETVSTRVLVGIIFVLSTLYAIVVSTYLQHY